MVCIHLAQDGSHARHVVTLAESSWVRGCRAGTREAMCPLPPSGSAALVALPAPQLCLCSAPSSLHLGWDRDETHHSAAEDMDRSIILLL